MRNRMKQPIFKMFAKKQKKRGALWASLLSLGISAAVFGVTKGKRKLPALPIQNMVKSFTPGNKINMMDNAALTEFSEELLESALNKDNNKQ